MSFILGGAGRGDTGQAPQGAPGDLIKETTTATFMADVVEESRDVPVLVDFWAPWCGPCKQLTPVLEKAVTEAGGRVKLVKMNIDEHPDVAGQLGVQSIPAVFAFKNGQPIDGFMGALPESQVKSFIDRIAGPPEANPLDEMVEKASELLEQGAIGEAAQIYGTILQHDPENVAAMGGLVKCFTRSRDLTRARQTLDLVPADKADDPAIASARAALELAEEAAKIGDAVELGERLAAHPNDHDARFKLALIMNAEGDRIGAVDALLEIIRADRNWNEEAARKQLLTFFEAWGPQAEGTKTGRRKLSALLFS